MAERPENRRTGLPDRLTVSKQALAQGVTRVIDALYHAGEIKAVGWIQASLRQGLEVVRVTRSVSALQIRTAGKNIRLKEHL